MVAVPAFVATDIFVFLCLAGIVLCLAYGLSILLQQFAGPVSSIWPDLGAAISNASNAIASWATNWANQLGGSVYSWIQAPANNAITLLNRVSDVAYSVTNALIRLHNRIGAVEGHIGNWLNYSSIADTLNYTFSQVNSLSSSLNNVITFANAIQTDLTNAVNGLNGLIAQTYTNAVSAAESYVNSSINGVYRLLSADVTALNTSITNVSTYAQAVDADARSLASNAISTSESYTNQAVNALESALVSYINSSVGGVRTELLDDVSRATSSLQASISGVSTDLKAQLVQAAANLAAADASLSSDLKQQLVSLANQVASQTGALSTELKADFATATASINSVRDSLSSTLTADVANLSNTIIQSEGALSRDLQGQIADVAAAAQAARNALQVSLSASIASVAAQATTTARTLAADETNCIQPTCDAFLPQVPSAKAILSAGSSGLFLAIIAAAISDPLDTAALFQPAVQGLSQPILNDVTALVP